MSSIIVEIDSECSVVNKLDTNLNGDEHFFFITELNTEENLSCACQSGFLRGNESLLHILLSRTCHNINQTAELCKLLIDKGVDVNQFDQKGRSALQYLIISNYSDDELEPIYQVLFSQNNIIVNHKNAWGKTPIEIATKTPYRKLLLERIRHYE